MRTTVAIAVFLLIIAAASRAEAQWVVRPFVGVSAGSTHGFVDLEGSEGAPRLFFGGALGWQRPSGLGVEVDFAAAPRFFKGTGDLVTVGRVSTIMGNLIWMLPRPAPSARIRPYVSGGIGVVRVRFEDVLDAFSSRSSLLAGNAGGGVEISVRPRFGVTADVRYVRSVDGEANRGGFGDEFVAFGRVTGGALLRF